MSASCISGSEKKESVEETGRGRTVGGVREYLNKIEISRPGK